ncbi:MAG: ABC transporter substrate-binding protein [bacterium]|nr:ABC transporter substrate-binding protein [bacterium]
MSYRKLSVLIVAGVVLSLIAAQGGVISAQEKAEIQELKVAPAFFAGTGFGGVAGGGDMAMLDPVRRGTWSFHSLLWVPLIAGDTEGNVIPEKSLAESFEISDDGTVYTFNLRPDAVYSDGTPIVAQHVVDVLGYYAMMTHSKAIGYRSNFGPGKRFYWDVVGFMDAIKDENCPYEQFGSCEIEGVNAVDDHTVTIALTAPSDSFLKRLQVGIAIFKPEDMFAGKGVEYGPLDFWTAHAAGSGPYKMGKFRAGEGYEMVINENYFGPKPQITKITVLAVSQDVNTILTAFANRELDMVPFSIPADGVRQAAVDPYLAETMVQIPTWIVEQFWMTPNAPLDDIHVRRAFTMAVDRDTLIEVLNAGSPVVLHERTNMHRSPAVPHCSDETAAVEPLPFDTKMALEELKKSKYWPDVLNMEINLYSRNQDDLTQMEIFQSMLQTNLGLKKVTVHTEQVADRMNPPFPVHFWYNTQQPWYADLIDTMGNMPLKHMHDKPWKPDDIRPFIGLSYEPELKELIARARDENDPEKRCELVGKAGQMWNDTAFSLDYAIQMGYYLIAPWVQGDIHWYRNAGQGKPLNIEDWWIAKH